MSDGVPPVRVPADLERDLSAILAEDDTERRSLLVLRARADFPSHVEFLDRWLYQHSIVASAQDAPSEDTIGNRSPRAEPVQSTATAELLQKLAQSPELDTNRYQIEGEIGRGGIGAILRIYDRHLNRRLAMKVLLERPSLRSSTDGRHAHQTIGRFLEEAQVTSQLDHPGVVPVHELGLDHTGKVYFTMRLVKGSTASDTFRRARANKDGWTTTRALEVVLKICDTMAFAHDKGVLHRDLKPANVMVGRFGEVYVVDWGLAKVLGQEDRHDLRIRTDDMDIEQGLDTVRQRDAESDGEASVLTENAQLLGTANYMPPEQARSEVLDQRADVYSIGAILYELLTGQAPYALPGQSQPWRRIVEAVVQGPPRRIDDLAKDAPVELVAIADKAMAREREKRYPSAIELAADLRAFLDQRSVKAYRTGALIELKLWVRRNKPLAASLAAAVLILIVGVVVSTSLANRNAVLAVEKSAKVREFEMLAGMERHKRAVNEEGGLYPAWPRKIAAMESWLDGVERTLLAMQPEITKTVRDLEERALASTEIGQKADWTGLRVEAESDRFLHSTLVDLLGKLTSLATLEKANVEQRLRWAKLLRDDKLTSAHPNARHSWNDVRSAVANNPRYAGLDIDLLNANLTGLVPIGENPVTHLWEFYELRSAWDGNQDPREIVIPEHEGDGSIAVAEGTGIVFVLLPGGTFTMGSLEHEESAPHAVSLSSFFIARHELTKGQWLRLWTWQESLRTPSVHAAGGNDPAGHLVTLRHPIENVDWTMSDLVLRSHGMVLPTEAQWEYACRAGSSTDWWCGDDVEGLATVANVADQSLAPLSDKIKPESFNDGFAVLAPVGSYSPNAFGLFDVHGNVGEWCLDEYGKYEGPVRPGDGLRLESTDSHNRINRGGSWVLAAAYAKSSYRAGSTPASRLGTLGLRAARSLHP